MRLHIRHETTYTYDSPVQNSIQYIRLVPRNTPQQRVHDWQLTTPGEVSQMTDGFGNPVTVMTLDHAVSDIILSAEGIVDLTGKPLTRNDSPFPPQVFLRQTRLTEADRALKDFVAPYSGNKRSLMRLMKDLRARVEFMPGATTVTHSASEAFALGAGVCQDHTHIFLACCRHIGVPARYVSGYIHSSDDDHVATHAWAEAWIGSNWHTFDVVNTLNVAESHIKLAVGLDYLDAAPVRGVRSGGGTEHMSTTAWVTRAGDSQ